MMSHRLIWFGKLALICILANLFTPAAFGQTRQSDTPTPPSLSDPARNAFADNKFPWYDSQQKSVQPVKLNPAPDSIAADRSSLQDRELAPPKPASGPFSLPQISFWWFDLLKYALIFLLFMIAVGLFIWFLRKWQPSKDLDDDEELSDAPAISAARVSELPFEVDASNLDFRARAARARDSGDYAAAVVFLFSHLLLSLDRNQWLRLRKGKTNRQYSMELGSAPAIRMYFQDLMFPFERVFFGNKTVAAHEFEPLWNRLNEIETTIKQNRGGRDDQ